MSHSSSSSSHRPPAAAILVVPLVVALVLTLFAWPAAKLGPRDLPVGVAGPAVAGPIERQLEAREGAFELHRYAGEAAAREAIEEREVYGAFVATPQGPKVLTASAGSQAVAQQLTHAADGAGATVEDVVPAGPQATGLASSVLPLVIAGILVGVVGALAASRGLGRAGLVVVGSVLTGLAATALVQGWLDVIGGDWVANAGALSLTVLAIAASLAGLYAVVGKAGLAIGALTMIFVGNPFSGVGSAPELLPEPAGAIGQLLPPGAGGNLLRSTGFFDGAGGAGHLTVLAAWAVAGLAFLLAAELHARRSAPAEAAAPAA
jgi:hypothetical protein